jgi:hypothetical protein
MAQQKFDETNRGVLFENDKQGNDKRPDYTGKVTIAVKDYTPNAEGLVEIRLSAWKKPTKAGGELLSISAQPPQG